MRFVYDSNEYDSNEYTHEAPTWRDHFAYLPDCRSSRSKTV